MVKVEGASPKYEASIRAALASFPEWLHRGARLSGVRVSGAPEVEVQIAMFRHGTRDLLIKPNAGNILVKAIGHEMGHAIDDYRGFPHYFTSTDAWVTAHRNQPFFVIPKYRDEPLEYFADTVVNYCLQGSTKLKVTRPEEVRFLEQYVIPTLQNHSGEET